MPSMRFAPPSVRSLLCTLPAPGSRRAPGSDDKNRDRRDSLRAGRVWDWDTAGAAGGHGDCHSGNILWRDDNAHFVDLDDAMMAPAIQDIWMLLSGNRDRQNAQLSEIIDGYNEFFDFHPRELKLIDALRTLRIINYTAWIAKRWNDPAFPMAFPWFNTIRFWSEHILELREQFAALGEPNLKIF